MALDEKAGSDVPQDTQTAASHVDSPPHTANAEKKDAKDLNTASSIEKELALVEEGFLKNVGHLPSAEEQIDALGIPNWRELEKKIVRRLDMTLMPCVWCLYFFNYLDRASIGHARLSTFDADLNLQGSNFSSAVSILSLGYGKTTPTYKQSPSTNIFQSSVSFPVTCSLPKSDPVFTFVLWLSSGPVLVLPPLVFRLTRD
jgi:hypothetical protein